MAPLRITYDIGDCAGNAAARVTRTVEIADTTAPGTIIHIPEDRAEYLLHESVLADWSVIDHASDLTITALADVGTAIDTTHPGEYTLTVTARDGSGNESTIVATYFVRYRLEMDPESFPRAFEIPIAEGVTIPALPLEPLVIPYRMPIHLDFTLHDVPGTPQTKAIPTITVIHVTEAESSEAREILRLEFVAFDEEAGWYGHALCSTPESLLEPGLYDLWLGLGDVPGTSSRGSLSDSHVLMRSGECLTVAWHDSSVFDCLVKKRRPEALHTGGERKGKPQSYPGGTDLDGLPFIRDVRYVRSPYSATWISISKTTGVVG